MMNLRRRQTFLIFTISFLTLVGLWLTGSFDPSITIVWKPESTSGTTGFHIYRSTSPDGPFERITEEAIEVATSKKGEAKYRYIDYDIEPDVVYYYQWEEIKDSGERIRHDFESPALIARSNWMLLVAWGVGTFLLVWLVNRPLEEAEVGQSLPDEVQSEG